MTNTETVEESQPQCYKISVRLISPVCLAATVTTGNLTRTLDYIPGSSVRGALAAYWLESGKRVDSIFERLFISGEVTYGNLCLNGTVPAPLSARSCKHEPGFILNGGHGVVDWLLLSFLRGWSEKIHHGVTSPQHEACRDPHRGNPCGAPLERFTPFYLLTNGSYKSVETSRLRRVLTRSATDDRLQTAEHGPLYSIEVLDPTATGAPPQFCGTVVCATSDIAEIARCELLNPAFNEQPARLFVGAARSRGLGELETDGCQPYQAPLHSLAGRLQKFNERLRRWGLDDGRFYFSITLHTDAIIQDEYFRPRAILPEALLAWEAGLDSGIASRLRLETCFTETRIVSGWNAALRMPKTDVTAIKAGAVFLYSMDGLDEHKILEGSDEKKLANGLVCVESRGLGLRRTEGFGRIVVCDPFHLDAGEKFL